MTEEEKDVKEQRHDHTWDIIPNSANNVSGNYRFYCRRCLKVVDLLYGGYEKPKLVVFYEEVLS